MRLPHHDLRSDLAAKHSAASLCSRALTVLAVTARDWWPAGQPPSAPTRRSRVRPSQLRSQFLPTGPLAPYGAARLLLGTPGQASAFA